MKLNPDHQFPSTEANVKIALELYGLTLNNFTAATSGIENTTLIITAAEGRFVLRIYRQKNKDSTRIEQEISFVDHLRNNGIKVPSIITNIHKEKVSTIEIDGMSWRVILMDFISGSHTDTYTPVLLHDMADAQSRMHLLSEKLTSNEPSTITELKEGVFIQLIDMTQIKDPRLVAFLGRAKLYRKLLDSALPTGLCHLDYDRENILADPNGRITAILDFDDLAAAPFVVDLGYTLWEIWYTNGKQAADQYLALYEQQRPLNESEKSFLMPVILFRHYVICTADIVRDEDYESSLDKNLELETAMSERDF